MKHGLAWLRSALQVAFAVAIPVAVLASRKWPEVLGWILVGAPTLLLGLYIGMAKWGWRWLPGWANGKPFIKGTYKVRINSEWKGATSHEDARDILGFATVRQDAWGDAVTLVTKTTTSGAVAVSLHPSAEDYQLVYTYRTRPPPGERHRNPRQYGTAMLDVVRGHTKILEGEYYTDQATNGTLRWELVGRRIKPTYAEALAYSQARGKM